MTEPVVKGGDLRNDPALRVSAYFSCLFLGTGVAMPFLPHWLEEERGLSGLEIGIVLSAAALSRIVVGPLIAAWADGFRDRRTPLLILPIAGAFAYAAFWQSQGFLALLVTGFAAMVVTSAITPLTEGAMLRASATGRLPYGLARAFSSAAFIVGSLLGGLMVARFGADIAVLWVIASLIATTAVGAVGLKSDAAPASAHTLGFRDRLRMGRGLLANRRFTMTILGCGLIQAAHAFYYNFSTLAWERQGIDPALTGGLWAIGVAAEIAFLAALPAFERRMSPEALILLGAGAAVVRWSAFALSPPLALIGPLQALHALTFAAAHVGALRVIHRETPESVAGLGQTFYAALASGALMGLAAIGSGALYDWVGANGYWAMAGLALAGGLLIAHMMRKAD